MSACPYNFKMLERKILLEYIDGLLEPWRFKDYGPNGLQVEGASQIERVLAGVTASRALIEAAIEMQADTLLVHHGLFWRGQDGRVVGWMRERLRLLLEHNINVIAYHLPLDAHPIWGNNAQLAKLLGLHVEERCGESGLIFLGHLLDAEHGRSAQALASWIEQQLQRTVLFEPGDGRALKRIAWCTGGAQGYFEQAIAAGVDAFITGEISEPQAHYARETGVAFLACGHHASERYGVEALAGHLAERFDIWQTFVDIPNPA